VTTRISRAYKVPGSGANTSNVEGPSPPALECRGLSKFFGGVRAVDGIDAGFEAGVVTGLVGPNGAGKTTLFHLVSGALKPDRGEVRLGGARIDGLPPWAVARLGVGRLFQDARVFPKLSVIENLLVACRGQLGEKAFAALIRPGRVRGEERRLAEDADRWLELVGLHDRRESLADELSFGQQKLLGIARLLSGGAEVFLLDEPTAGVNPQLIPRVLGVIRQLAAQGCTVVLIEHNMEVIIDVTDCVYFMDEGQIAAFGLPEDVLGDAALRLTYIGA
jgi:ABC-type branched-subunit amino acid transport system ATPase component